MNSLTSISEHMQYVDNPFRKAHLDAFQDESISPIESGFDSSARLARRIARFHQSLPGYAATPLNKLYSLASSLNIGQLWVKDESQRFDLNAFKILGASYAVATLLHQRLGLDEEQFNFTDIVACAESYKDLSLVTATDGNHGRAVAWAAHHFGCKAQVFMPQGTLEVRAQAIRDYGANTLISDLNYDGTVELAAKTAAKENGILVQDTAWKNYTAIPILIQQGYFTLISEAFEQLETKDRPTHIFVQAGVGSLPAALVERLHTVYSTEETDTPRAKFIVVEASGADCLLRSVSTDDGSSVSIPGHLSTIMAGLACGTPSSIALRSLRNYADGFLSCADEVTKIGMRTLYKALGSDPKIISGESGAVTLGAVHQVCSNPELAKLKRQLGLNKSSRVLLFSTEGDTAPELYRAIVEG